MTVNASLPPASKTIAGGTYGKTIVLWESELPIDGYEARKAGVAARKLVDELHEEKTE